MWQVNNSYPIFFIVTSSATSHSASQPVLSTPRLPESLKAKGKYEM